MGASLRYLPPALGCYPPPPVRWLRHGCHESSSGSNRVDLRVVILDLGMGALRFTLRGVVARLLRRSGALEGRVRLCRQAGSCAACRVALAYACARVLNRVPAC